MEIIKTDYGYKKIYPSGTVKHYNHKDKSHNPNGPATEYPDGSKVYYVNGVLHRTDGPAIEWPNVSKEYYLNGIRHRLDGPAIEKINGDKVYYKHGKLHNLNGPAVVGRNYELHFVNGKYLWKQ